VDRTADIIDRLQGVKAELMAIKRQLDSLE
jgi:hypothetical protein